MLKTMKQFMVFEAGVVSGAEKLVASIGAMISISLICLISYKFTGADGAALIVPAMGASAVLLFAVPHGKLSQPWALFGGSLISALVGVICYQYIPNTFLAAGLSVGLAVGAMHLTKSMHPPGGAMALVAVTSGPSIHSLGYGYIITPVLLNVMVIFIVAVIFNSLFPWRRYPAAAMMRFTEQQADVSKEDIVEKQHIEQAISDMDLILDVTTEDMQRLIQLTLEHAQHKQLTSKQIKLHNYYTNGEHGLEWSVRRIIDESASINIKDDMVTYQVVEGRNLNKTGGCTREEFSAWAKRELFLNN